jgi:hypothetical protein
MEQAYETTLETITPFQDTDESNLRVDSGGILLSYFQDKVQSVPYIAKRGAGESGKTRSLEVINALTYRPMMAVDITAPNIYRYYGQHLQAAGTIIHDEIDDAGIDRNVDLRSIYNAGYKIGAKVPRIGGENNDKQSYWNCYGVKWFGGVDLPSSKTFRSRCIVQNWIQGVPEKIDITEEDRQHFRQVRKGLLVLRLLKAFDTFEPVNTSLRGRSRELYTPLLTMVKGTKHYERLLEPLFQLDRERHEDDRQSKQAYVARAVIGCWLAAASDKLGGVKIRSVDDLQLEGVTEAPFVSNDAVVANMGLSEITNDKGRKILVSDDLPFTLSRSEVGRIQSENLRGKGVPPRRDDGKVRRGHLFTLKTIRALHRRYHLLPDSKGEEDTDCNACYTCNAPPEGPGGISGSGAIKEVEKKKQNHEQNSGNG